ncbi:MAG: baseplate J/gp47 family protein [Roseburia sp.]
MSFYTMEDAEIPAGEAYVDVQIKCASTGEATNAYNAGEINQMMAPIAYIGSVANVSKTEGGSDAESDEDLAERIYLAPSEYSTAGPEDAYVAKVKKCSGEHYGCKG